jgi:hypothetical protein
MEEREKNAWGSMGTFKGTFGGMGELRVALGRSSL